MLANECFTIERKKLEVVKKKKKKISIEEAVNTCCWSSEFTALPIVRLPSRLPLLETVVLRQDMEFSEENAALPDQDGYLHLNGTTLEGGGQLVRNALALSALTCKPVRITRIRGNRPKDGGLKSSHAAAVKFLAEVCEADLTGDHVGSKEILFRPKRGDVATKGVLKREYNIELNNPGSVFLIFQALYPYLLFSSGALSKPVKLSITGGTNVTFSPSFEYMSQVLVPTFAKLGLPPLSVTLQGRGWTTGRTQLGSVTFLISPLSPGTSIPAFKLSNRGDITKVSISILASNGVPRTKRPFSRQQKAQASRTS